MGRRKRSVGVRGSAVQGSVDPECGEELYQRGFRQEWHREQRLDGAICIGGVIRGVSCVTVRAATRSRARQRHPCGGPFVDVCMPC